VDKHDLIEMIEDINDEFNIVQNDADPKIEDILIEIRNMLRKIIGRK